MFLQVIEQGKVNRGHIFQYIVFFGHQHNHRLFIRPLLQGIYFGHRFSIGGITSYSPHGISG